MVVVIINIALVIGFIILIRLFGAWMLRINEIIALQKEILKAITSISRGEVIVPSNDPKYMKYMTDEEKAKLYDLKNKINK